MPLQKNVLTSGFEAAIKKNKQVYEQMESEIKKLKADVGHSLSAEQFQESARSIAESKTESMKEDTIDRYAEAIKSYLNGMQDPFGDGPITPFTTSDTRPLIEPMAESYDRVNIGKIDGQVQATWAGYFPIKFKLSTPPPGSVKKTSSVGAPTPIGSMAPVVQGDHDSIGDALSELANIIHSAATPIQVTVNHLISSPSGPTPGPPIIKPVL